MKMRAQYVRLATATTTIMRLARFVILTVAIFNYYVNKEFAPKLYKEVEPGHTA
jgi:hypothetical protein